MEKETAMIMIQLHIFELIETDQKYCDQGYHIILPSSSIRSTHSD